MDEMPPGLCATDPVEVEGASVTVTGYQTPQSSGLRVLVARKDCAGLTLSARRADQLGVVMSEAIPGLAVAVNEVVGKMGGGF
jgi:hypothetical protein